MKHTELPFIKEVIKGTVNIFGADGYVCDMGSDDEIAHSDADIIINRVNSHDKLVTALDGLLLGLRMIRGIDLEEYVPQELEQAREALAAAKGE